MAQIPESADPNKPRRVAPHRPLPPLKLPPSPPSPFSMVLPTNILSLKLLLYCTALVLLLPLAFVALRYKTSMFYPPALSNPFLMNPKDAIYFPVLQVLQKRYFNETLLRMAEDDLSAPEERRQINTILERGRYPSRIDRVDDYTSRYAYRARRYRNLPAHRNRMRDRRSPVPTLLNSARYDSFWPAFRQSLQTWVLNKRHEPQVMKELISKVKDPIDQHYIKLKNTTDIGSELGKPYRTCAVVGNSGILLNQSHGALIDSHDMVMRLNNARIRGFEQHVGSKTTISFVNSNILHSCERRTSCYCHPYGSEVPLVIYICQVVHLMDVAVCSSKLQSPIITTDPRFDTLCARIVKYYSLKMFVEKMGKPASQWSAAHEGTLFHYSSGMQAVLLAVGLCDKVSLFGFGKAENARHHYHTLQKEELRLHDYYAEYQFYKDLITRDPQLVPFLNEAGITIPPIDIYW